MESYSIEIFDRMDITNKKSVVQCELNRNELIECLGVEEETIDSIIEDEYFKDGLYEYRILKD